MNFRKFAPQNINRAGKGTASARTQAKTRRTNRQNRHTETDIGLQTFFSQNPKPPIEVNENKHAGSSRPQGRELIVLVRLRGYLAVPGFWISQHSVPLLSRI